MTPYHDRMPVLLAPEDFDGWLDGSLGTEALRPAAESASREWIVSSRVNRTGHGDDDPTIVEPVAAVSRPTCLSGVARSAASCDPLRPSPPFFASSARFAA